MAHLFHPAHTSLFRGALVFGAVLAGSGATAAAVVYRSPYFTRVDTVPPQPVPFSHEHHVAGIGIDCRYCHTTVESSAFAGMPSTKTCMRCHSQIWTDADVLAPVRGSYQSGRSLVWTRVNDLPSFVYFNHGIHVAKGIGCVRCHGRVDRMPLMAKRVTLSMRFCLECHRDPEPRRGPRSAVFELGFVAGGEPPPPPLSQQERVHMLQCDACHR